MTKKGIVDPWRQVDPIKPPVRTRTEGDKRIDLHDVDFDADLAIPGTYVLRSGRVSFKVEAPKLNTGSDAVRIIAECVLSLWANKALADLFVADGIGAKAKGQSRGGDLSGEGHSLVKGEDASIWFMGQTLDQGLFKLSKILRSVPAAPIVKRYGITIMLAG